MSSQTDIKARDAKIARLEALLEIHQQRSASEVNALIQKLATLEAEVTTLELEKRLSPTKPKDPAPQPTASTGSPDPALQAEISRLQSEIAVKDAAIAAKDAIIAARIRSERDLITTIDNFKGASTAWTKEATRALEAEAALKEDQSSKEVTPEISITDTDMYSKASSTSLPKDVEGDDQTEPERFSYESVLRKIASGTVPAPPVFPEPVRPNYSQVLQAPKPKPEFPKGTLAPVQKLVFGGRLVYGENEGKQQVSRDPWEQNDSATGTKALETKTRKGASEKQTQEKGLTSHPYPPNVHYPLTLSQAKSGATQAKDRTVSSAVDAFKGADQSSQKKDVDLSGAISKLQIGQEVPVAEDKKSSGALRGEAAPFILKSDAVVYDSKGNKWTADMLHTVALFGMPFEPEVEAAIRSGLMPAPNVPPRPLPKVESNKSPWASSRLKSSTPPAQELETKDSSLSNASTIQESDETGSNTRKRSNDEEQLGTSKRLRST